MDSSTLEKGQRTVCRPKQIGLDCTATDLFYFNCLATAIYGSLYIINYGTIDYVDGNGGNIGSIITGHVSLGFLLSIITAVFLCISPKLNNLSVNLCCLNIALVHVYTPFCILSLLGFVDFGTVAPPTKCVGCVPLLLEFIVLMGMSVISYIVIAVAITSMIADKYIDPIMQEVRVDSLSEFPQDKGK
jgi:hypothetical protein